MDQQLVFEFFINEENTVIIPLLENSTLLFSAYFLTHRQQCKGDPNLPTCFNLACYANARLFYNMRRTLQRLEEETKE